MEPLLRLERWLDTSLTRVFARLFRSPVDPIEIAAALQRECDDKASRISNSRTLVPNEFVVELPTSDFSAINTSDLAHLLTETVDSYGTEKSYSFAGPITISVVPNAALESGLFALRSTSLAEVPQLGDGPIVLEVGTRKIALAPGLFRIGRDDSMDLRLDDPGISRHHCDIEITGSTITVHDRNSTNGTLVNGVAITRALIGRGSRVRIGATDLILHVGEQ